MSDVKTIIGRLKEWLNFATDQELADYLGVAHGTVGMWKQRNSMDYKLVMEKIDIDLNYLFRGVENPEIKMNKQKEYMLQVEIDNQKMIVEALLSRLRDATTKEYGQVADKSVHYG